MADEQVTYEQAGVSTAEGARAVQAIKGAVHSTYRPEVVGDIGGFGGLFSIAAARDMEDPLLVSGTDGVGTKLKVAQMLGVHNTVGIDLVAMCVNDILATGAEPLFFLDYVAVGKLRAEEMAQVVGGIAAGCRKAGCALIGGEMAEHPGVMAADDYDLAGFCVGVVDAPKMLGKDNVREGDVILGLASSGIHSNGYSLVRAAVTDRMDDAGLLEPRAELGGESLADALLAPTAIYSGAVVRALAAGAHVHALAHITGGGITENLDRAMPADLDALVERGADGSVAWDVPPVIGYVSRAAGLTPDEAFKTFNMGVGMAVVCAPEDAEQVSAAFAEQGFPTFAVGTVVPGEGKVRYTA